jgi:hypothetical protein
MVVATNSSGSFTSNPFTLTTGARNDFDRNGKDDIFLTNIVTGDRKSG